MGSEKVIEEKKQGQALLTDKKEGNNKKLFIESYGCAMNFADSEVVASILQESGYGSTKHFEEDSYRVLPGSSQLWE